MPAKIVMTLTGRHAATPPYKPPPDGHGCTIPRMAYFDPIPGIPFMSCRHRFGGMIVAGNDLALPPQIENGFEVVFGGGGLAPDRRRSPPSGQGLTASSGASTALLWRA